MGFSDYGITEGLASNHLAARFASSIENETIILKYPGKY